MPARAAKGAYVDQCPRCGFDFVKCRVPNCSRPHRMLGLCDAHYARQRKYGDVLAAIPIQPTGNRFPGIIPKR